MQLLCITVLFDLFVGLVIDIQISSEQLQLTTPMLKYCTPKPFTPDTILAVEIFPTKLFELKFKKNDFPTKVVIRRRYLTLILVVFELSVMFFQGEKQNLLNKKDDKVFEISLYWLRWVESVIK